jgi:hypothetical protein
MLLPRFLQLCYDNIRGVRKACAACSMAVSRATHQEIQRTLLLTLFVDLINDPSCWVRQAAFQSLGPFISTFANPSSSGQHFKDEKKVQKIKIGFKVKTLLRMGKSDKKLFLQISVPLIPASNWETYWKMVLLKLVETLHVKYAFQWIALYSVLCPQNLIRKQPAIKLIINVVTNLYSHQRLAPIHKIALT